VIGWVSVPLQIADLEDPEILLTTNNAAVPDVNELTNQKAGWLIAHARLTRVATLDGRVAGVIVVLSDTAELNSEYFRWFTARYENFIYIDRVIVAAPTRRLGVATMLYSEVDQIASKDRLAVASDVYCDPPNAASIAFHQKMGYGEVGQQFSPAEGKTVSKLMRYVEHAHPRQR
jgi:predicted GNAT superfamily acetyltransferase